MNKEEIIVTHKGVKKIIKVEDKINRCTIKKFYYKKVLKTKMLGGWSMLVIAGA